MKTKSEVPKVKKTPTAKPEMRAEYDFSNGVRGKYARQYAEGVNVVVLDPDVARVFKDSASVNVALRKLLTKRTSKLSLAVSEKPPRYSGRS